MEETITGTMRIENSYGQGGINKASEEKRTVIINKISNTKSDPLEGDIT
jgi:hypothetical protein